jgi:hypothetical protein
MGEGVGVAAAEAVADTVRNLEEPGATRLTVDGLAAAASPLAGTAAWRGLLAMTVRATAGALDLRDVAAAVDLGQTIVAGAERGFKQAAGALIVTAALRVGRDWEHRDCQ